MPKTGTWRKLNETLHGEFVLNGQLRKYAFMTKEGANSKIELGRLLSVWKLGFPNLVVQLNGHNCRTENFVTDEMISDVDEFKMLKERIGGDSVTREAINDHVINRVKSMLSNVAVACDMTNSWILHRGIPSMNHILMQDALQSSKATPVIVSVDAWDLQYSPEVYGDNAGAKFVDFHEELLAAAKPLKEKAARVQEKLNIDSSEQFRLFDYTGTFSEESEYLHCQFTAPMAAATHFIFTEDYDSFDPSILGNAGYILVSGGYGLQAAEIVSALQSGDPAVLINNTGGETQRYARLVKKVLDLQQSGLKSAAELQKEARGILDYALKGTSSTPLGLREMDLPEVLRVIDLIIEQTTYFRETFMVVDVLEDTAHTVLQMILKSFVSKTVHAFEFGAGEADKNIVFEAWQTHRMLTMNANKVQRREGILVIATAIFVFIGTVGGVLRATVPELGDPDIFADGVPLLFYTCTVAPALATVCSGLIATMRYGRQAAALRAAAARIVNQIFWFRMRVGRYDVATWAHVEEAGADEGGAVVEQNESVRVHSARARFEQSLRDVMAGLSIGVGTEAHMEYRERLRSEDLRKYVENALYGKMIPDVTDLSGERGSLLLSLDAFDIEHLAPMTTQAYFHTRVKPLNEYFKSQSPTLANWERLFDCALILLTTSATVIASMGLQVWVPVVFAVTALLKTLSEYSLFGVRNAAMGSAVGELTQLEAFWASLSFVDRGLQSARSHLVSVTEAAVLSVLAAETGGRGLVSESVQPGVSEGANSKSKSA